MSDSCAAVFCQPSFSAFHTLLRGSWILQPAHPRLYAVHQWPIVLAAGLHEPACSKLLLPPAYPARYSELLPSGATGVAAEVPAACGPLLAAVELVAAPSTPIAQSLDAII